MSSQPIVVPGGDHQRLQAETHSVPLGSSADAFKTMTPPNVSRSLSRLSGMSEGQKVDNSSDKSLDSCKLTRKESYKAQRKNYRMEKKRVANELLSSFKDPTVIVMSDWLKVRGTLKSWTKLWCILKPGLLLLYKSPKMKSNHWVGTVLLNTCQVIERPSKKDGFCFKLFHPLEQSIWAPRGPEKEAIGAVVQPLPTSYLIFRAPSQAAGKCWLDALELSLRCSSLIVRSTSALPRPLPHDTTTTHETQWSEADYEKHFDDHEPADRQFRRSSVQAQSTPLPKLPSTESLSTSVNITASAPPVSPGLSGMSEGQKVDNSSDKSLDSCKLTRKESYKAQRKNYRMEKKRVANELLSSFKDPTVIVMSDWLKVRGTLKSWTKLWCILKPGLLLLYKSPKMKSNHWVGTVLLNTCQVIERPSKKDGFCFKLFHPLEQSIWAPRGPEKEAIGAVVQPLPTSYLIFRAPSQAAGKCWLDALELSLRCSSLIVRSTSALPRPLPHDTTTTHETQWSEADYEKHFDDHDLDDISQPENGVAADAEISASDSESETSAKEDQLSEPITETPYISNEKEVLGTAGEVVTELQEEQKSLIWFLMKQVRPGMDLSKVVLPTFILEPRSFLEKLADSYYHADLLSQAVLEDDAFTRMKAVVKWYLSGFYKKPQGLKKPYNPLLGETFRCYWQHVNGSRTFYLAEQLSHHPPISGFYVTNRQDGFTISATIIAKSKFYGNSTSAVLDGVAVLTMLPRGEDYTMTIPYAHCKGILMGTLSMELGGKVNIICEKTGYHTELEFKLKPFLGGAELMNQVVGRIRLGKETLATISGYWDGLISITDKRTGQENIFFNPTPEIRKKRLKKYTVPLEYQGPWESEKLWYAVTQAINRDDQLAATEAKTRLEEAQRERAKERKSRGQEWIPKYFLQDIITGNWVYRHADVRPWDPRNDVVQYEENYIVRTKTRHKTPIMRTGSIVSTEPQSQIPLLQAESRSSLSVLKSSKRQLSNNMPMSETAHDSGSSSAEAHSDSSQSLGKRRRSSARIIVIMKEVESQMLEHGEKLNRIQQIVEQVCKKQRESGEQHHNISMFKSFVDTILIIIIVFLVQYFVSVWSNNPTKG